MFKERLVQAWSSNLFAFKLFRAFLAFTFLHAGVEKLTQETPDWFVERFSSTFFIHFPGGLGVTFHLLGAMESLAGLLMAVSVVFPSRFRVRISYLACLTVFFALGFGSRISHQFSEAGMLFNYFALTLILQTLDERAHPITV